MDSVIDLYEHAKAKRVEHMDVEPQDVMLRVTIMYKYRCMISKGLTLSPASHWMSQGREGDEG